MEHHRCQNKWQNSGIADDIVSTSFNNYITATEQNIWSSDYWEKLSIAFGNLKSPLKSKIPIWNTNKKECSKSKMEWDGIYGQNHCWTEKIMERTLQIKVCRYKGRLLQRKRIIISKNHEKSMFSNWVDDDFRINSVKSAAFQIHLRKNCSVSEHVLYPIRHYTATSTGIRIVC